MAALNTDKGYFNGYAVVAFTDLNFSNRSLIEGMVYSNNPMQNCQVMSLMVKQTLYQNVQDQVNHLERSGVEGRCGFSVKRRGVRLLLLNGHLLFPLIR